MGYNEADTRAKLIDPALHSKGWTEDFIKREMSAGAIEIIAGRARRKSRGRMDYTLRLKISRDTQPVAIALIEAKSEDKHPSHGLEQGKLYADCERLNIKFIFSSNGHQYVEFDRFTGLTTPLKPMNEFPTPDELRCRYEKGMGFSLVDDTAKPLLVKYTGGEAQRRYYQDAAIRAVFEKVAQGNKRALLSLATGAGKTFIAVNMLKRIADAGQLRKALFICDRDELRTQAMTAFQGQFGTNAATVENKNPQKNARVIIATYQSLGISSDEDDSSFLTDNYPENYFSHIVIDECHRSAWGKWSQVLTRNPDAVQIGLTATPRQLKVNEKTAEAKADDQMTADNYKHFGEPVYEYTMLQAIEDGYLAACEIEASEVNLDNTGITIEDILKLNPVNDITGEPITEDELKELYRKTDFESKLMLPDRVMAMCGNLFNKLIKAGTPEQKTIIFCVRDAHAQAVANQLNNLYANWCKANGVAKPAQHFAFKCTYDGGSDYIADMKGSNKDYFIAVTVDLLSTGVDIPAVRNIGFFKYIKSPISFYQMVGRGTRLAENKLMFTIYDYTDATRLFAEEFVTKPKSPSTGSGEPSDPPVIVRVEGFDAVVDDTGKYIVGEKDGVPCRIPVEEYKAQIAKRIVENASTIEDFREIWVDPSERRSLLEGLVRSGFSPEIVRKVEDMNEFDLFDVLSDMAYGIEPKTRKQRAFSFGYKHKEWLKTMQKATSEVILAIASQFEKEGTDALESNYIFRTPEVRNAGGLAALKLSGDPKKLLDETKERMFAA